MDKLTGAAAAEGYRAADIPNDTLSGIMLKNQWYMLTYHNGVHQAHPYSSWWFQIVVLKGGAANKPPGDQLGKVGHQKKEGLGVILRRCFYVFSRLSFPFHLFSRRPRLSC